VLAFSVGRRRCPGENVAKMELFIFIAAIVQSFRIEPRGKVSLERVVKSNHKPKEHEIIFTPIAN